MVEKKEVKVKLLAIIIFVLIAIFIAGGAIYIIFMNNRTDTDVPSIVTNQTQANNVNTEKTTSQYYEPTEKEKVRTAELESILKNNLPVMDGSTSTIPLEGGIKAALYGITQEQAEASVVHATTYGSYDNLLEGKCDIIFSTPLSENQYESAKKANIELVEVPVVLEGFVFVVNAKNPINSLTQQQLKDIYSGKITNWKELGGNDAKIIAYQRNETSGSQNYMKAFMKDSNLMNPKTSFTPASMVGLMDAIATYDNAENSIGYSVYAYAANMYGNGNEIKFIKVDGVEPTKETMASREYPLLNYNYAIYNKQREDATKVKELTEWILTYNGQVAMVNAGYVPVKNVQVKELEIKPYTLKGTCAEIKNSKPDDYYYTVHPDEMAGIESSLNMDKSDYRIEKLKDKELQNKINTFINESINKLQTRTAELETYIKLLNDYYNKSAAIQSDIYINNGIVTNIYCINGYLSVGCYLQYCEGFQSGNYFAYDGYSKIYDLYTGKELSLSDLFYKDANFVDEINKQIEKRIPYEVELSIRKYETKRNFSSLPKDGFTIGFDFGHNNGNLVIVFPKDNPYFVDGASFEIDTYLDNMSCIYKARDMSGIWEDDVNVDTRMWYPSCTTPAQKETEKYEYNIFYLNSHNSNLDKVINNYIDTNLINDIYISDLEKKIEEKMREENPNYDFSDDWRNENGKRMISIYTTMCGYKYIRVNVEVGMEFLEESYFYFDIDTREKISKDVVTKWGRETIKDFYF